MHYIQVGCLEWFARFWELPIADMWGYVTNCGTEGNLHGTLYCRDMLINCTCIARVLTILI